MCLIGTDLPILYTFDHVCNYLIVHTQKFQGFVLCRDSEGFVLVGWHALLPSDRQEAKGIYSCQQGQASGQSEFCQIWSPNSFVGSSSFGPPGSGTGSFCPEKNPGVLHPFSPFLVHFTPPPRPALFGPSAVEPTEHLSDFLM